MCSDVAAMSLSFHDTPHGGYGRTFYDQQQNVDLNSNLDAATVATIESAAELLQTNRPRRSYRIKSKRLSNATSNMH